MKWYTIIRQFRNDILTELEVECLATLKDINHAQRE